MSTSKLIKELDKVFSIYIRRKDANEHGLVKCFTCGKYNHWQKEGNIHCGHYISRVHMGTRWEEKNCKPQCYVCNMFKQGMGDVFGLKLVEMYGADVLKLLAAKKNNTVKLMPFELQFMIDEYQEKINAL